MTERATLRRDRHTCQYCGVRNCTSAIILQTPTGSPFTDKVSLTACRNCAIKRAIPSHHVPVYKHLIEHGFTVRNGHPYLMAIIRAIQTPMQPTPELTEAARTVLRSVAALQDRIPHGTVRAYNRDMPAPDYYKALDDLAHHGYLHYDPIEPKYITRYDKHAKPPITPTLEPLVNHAATLTRLHTGTPNVDEPALFLAKLYGFAGMHISGSKLRKFLRYNLPARAKDVHAMVLHKLLKYGRIVQPGEGREGGWVFTRNMKAYTDMDFFLLLEEFYRRPWHLIMPSDSELARGSKPHFRSFDQPLPPPVSKKAAAAQQDTQAPAEPVEPPLTPTANASDATEATAARL